MKTYHTVFTLNSQLYLKESYKKNSSLRFLQHAICMERLQLPKEYLIGFCASWTVTLASCSSYENYSPRDLCWVSERACGWYFFPVTFLLRQSSFILCFYMYFCEKCCCGGRKKFWGGSNIRICGPEILCENGIKKKSELSLLEVDIEIKTFSVSEIHV